MELIGKKHAVEVLRAIADSMADEWTSEFEKGIIYGYQNAARVIAEEHTIVDTDDVKRKVCHKAYSEAALQKATKSQLISVIRCLEKQLPQEGV